MDAKDVDYTLITAISRRMRKPVYIQFKKDRSPYGSYLIIGKDEYRISNRLDAWRDYCYKRKGHVNPTRVILNHKDKSAGLRPYPSKTSSKQGRRIALIEMLSKTQPTQEELDVIQREHLERVNDGYYKVP